MRFSENLFQSESAENVQNFQSLSHKNMSTSQMEGCFKNPKYLFLDKPMLALKWKHHGKAFCSIKTKKNSSFAISDWNWTWIQNHLVLKRTLNHFAKLAKWLSCVLSTYLYGAFDCMFLSCHVHVSEWIHTL